MLFIKFNILDNKNAFYKIICLSKVLIYLIKIYNYCAFFLKKNFV